MAPQPAQSLVTKTKLSHSLGSVCFLLSASLLPASALEIDAPTGAEVEAPIGEGTASIVFEVTVSDAEGAVMIALFDDPDAYDGDGEPARAVRVPADALEKRIRFSDLKPGEYAARAFHDRNGDGLLNTNPFGLPTEPFAFSGGAIARFGPPPFSEAKIDAPSGITIDTLRFAR